MMEFHMRLWVQRFRGLEVQSSRFRVGRFKGSEFKVQG